MIYMPKNPSEPTQKNIPEPVHNSQPQENLYVEDKSSRRGVLLPAIKTILDTVRDALTYIYLVAVKLTLGEEAAKDFRRRAQSRIALEKPNYAKEEQAKNTKAKKPAEVANDKKRNPVLEDKPVEKEKPVKCTQPTNPSVENDCKKKNVTLKEYVNDMINSDIREKTQFRVTERKKNHEVVISSDTGTRLTINKDTNSPVRYKLGGKDNPALIKLIYFTYQNYLNDHESGFRISDAKKQEIQEEIKDWVNNNKGEKLTFDIGNVKIEFTDLTFDSKFKNDYVMRAYVINAAPDKGMEKTERICSINFSGGERPEEKVYKRLEASLSSSMYYYTQNFNKMIHPACAELDVPEQLPEKQPEDAAEHIPEEAANVLNEPAEENPSGPIETDMNDIDNKYGIDKNINRKIMEGYNKKNLDPEIGL